jgi:hypothetical protein
MRLGLSALMWLREVKKVSNGWSGIELFKVNLEFSFSFPGFSFPGLDLVFKSGCQI